jgi:hypothetical protein
MQLGLWEFSLIDLSLPSFGPHKTSEPSYLWVLAWLWVGGLWVEVLFLEALQ